MQYAEVLIKQKTSKWDATFTYTIPPEYLAQIKRGCLVEVPFGHSLTEGAVVGLKRGLPAGLKGKIKQIKRVLQPNFYLNDEDFDRARWLADHFYSTWNEALFAFLPPIPLKVKDGVSVSLKRHLSRGSRRLLLQTDIERWRYYSTIARSGFEEGKSTVIIFPDIMKLQLFNHFVKKESFGKNILIYDSEGRRQERWDRWLALREGKEKVVLGTRLAILTLPVDTDTIIIDEVLHQGHYEEQSPRYNSREVAKYWQERFGMNVIEGDILPSLEQLKEAKHREIKLIKNTFPLPKASWQIIDMKKERGVISLPLESAIQEAIERKKSVLLFTPRKGSGGSTYCMDCDFVFSCPNCYIPLIFHEKAKMAICHHCNYKAVVPAHCPKCHSTYFKTGGVGIEKVNKWLNKFVGEGVPIIQIDKENKLTDHSNGGIYIATQAVFRYSKSFDVTGILGADALIDKPDFSAGEEAFRTFAHLALLTKECLILQTDHPELDIFRFLQTKDYSPFLQKLLQERRAHNYPPYNYLIKLTIKNANEETAQKEASNMAEKITRAKLDVRILGPAPAFLAVKRDCYYWQIILKSKKRLAAKMLREFVTDDWVVEFDPQSVLS